MFKRTKVVMLATNEKSNLVMNNIQQGLFVVGGNGILAKHRMGNCTNQHLYFLSDETIKEGDFFIDTITNALLQHKAGNELRVNDKKVIATTDSSLKSDIPKLGRGEHSDFAHYPSLPQPSQAFMDVFVREYNKGNIITEVMVEYETIEDTTKDYIIGKGQPAINILKINPKDNTITIKKVKDSWTREELPIEIIKDMISYCEKMQVYDKLGSYNDFYYKGKKWIEENL